MTRERDETMKGKRKGTRGRETRHKGQATFHKEERKGRVSLSQGRDMWERVPQGARGCVFGIEISVACQVEGSVPYVWDVRRMIGRCVACLGYLCF